MTMTHKEFAHDAIRQVERFQSEGDRKNEALALQTVARGPGNGSGRLECLMESSDWGPKCVYSARTSVSSGTFHQSASETQK